MIHEASLDRAQAVLLDIAESTDATVEERFTAATSLISAASFAAELAAPCDPVDDEAVDDAVADALIRAFRAGARWRKANPERRVPGERQILEQLADAASR